MIHLRFGLRQTAKVSGHIFKNKLTGKKRFPVVLMLEPLHACNLHCAGCGRIEEYKDTLDKTLTLEECLRSVDECGAPVVSICGGEPLVYKDIVPLCEHLARKKKIIYLCTNGLLLEKYLDQLTPNPYLKINLHIDGLAKTHDAITGMPGSFDIAIKGIKEAKKRGFYVCTNTTIYRQTDMDEIEQLFDMLTEMEVDGILVSPGYEYEAVEEKIFLQRKEIHEKFRRLDTWKNKVNYLSTPIFLKFLKGEKELSCTPWGNVTRNPMGWKSPCYLITDTHYPTFKELMENTPWEKYENRQDPRCKNCMVHCGFEATVAIGTNNTIRDYIELARWNIVR